jgi:hypothetical protein
MKLRIPMLAAFALLSTKAPAMSQVKNVLGEGNAPCSEWTKERTAKSYLGVELEAWARGYISGANVMQSYKDNLFVVTDEEMSTVEAWIDDYCAKHPSNKLRVATDLLVTTLIAR